MAKLIVEILGYGDLVAGSASNFADTQGHWADPWIALAAGRGLVIGTGDGNFVPDRQVSYDEAITMVVRALGYTDDCNELKNMTWPTNFKVKASELDLLDGVKSLAGGADRGGVAQLLFNALNAALVTVDVDGNVTYIFDSLDKDTKEAKILLSRLAEKDDLNVNPDHVDPDHKNYKGDVVDLTPYMYQTIVVYEKDDVVVFVSDVNSLVLKGTVVDDVDDNNYFVVEDAKEDKYTMTVGDDVEEFNIVNGTPVFLNGEEIDFEDTADLEDALEGAEVTVVLKGEDGDKISKTVSQDVIGIVARLATITVQAEEDFDEDEEEIIAYPDNVVLPLDDDEIDYDKVVVKGDAESLEDIEEDDVLTLFYGKGKVADDVKLEIVVSKATVEGKVTRVTLKNDKVDKVYIDGTSYSLNADFVDDEIAVKDEGTFFLDYEGKIFAVTTESDLAPDDYALVLSVTNGYAVEREEDDELIVLRDAKIKVLTAEGEEVTYVLDHEDLFDEDDTIIDDKLVITLEEGDLIIYDVNKDGEIDEIEVVDEGDLEEELKTTVNKFNLAKNAVIFSVPDYPETDDAKVVDADDLEDEIVAYVVRNDDKEIAVLIVLEGAGVEEKVYGIITDNLSIATDEDDEDVWVYVAYVDGVKVEYLGLADEDQIDKLHWLYELTISDGKLEAAETVTVDTATGTAINARVTTSIKAVDGEVYFLADDVVIYVLDEDMEFDKVGSKTDIRGKNFVVYDTVDEDGDYDIVVVWPVVE